MLRHLGSRTAAWVCPRGAAAVAAAGCEPWRTLCADSTTTSAAAGDTVDCVVVGAGVIGLACGRAAALAGLETVILEAEPSWGTLTSSRHSEVIHAGIYYPPGSLKARLCVEGKALLYEYCGAKGVGHSNLGKLVVATSEGQVPKLRQLQQSAAANGVTDLQLLSRQEAQALEPALSAAAALLSPSTGILDSHAYMESLLTDAQAAGAVLATHSRLLGATHVPGSISVASIAPSSSSSDSASARTDGSSRCDTASSSSSSSSSRRLLQLDIHDVGSGEVTQLTTRRLINAAGLSAQAVAATIQPLGAAAIPRQYLAKGNYFTLNHRAPFSRLIYPVPEDGGLGVHLTLDLAGGARFGPDVEWVQDAGDYRVDPRRSQPFYAAIRTYYPDLPGVSLQPSYCGIRPKLSGPGQLAADFVLQGPRRHGVRGLVNLFGIESPGLTSSLAIAQAVMTMLREG